METSNQWRMSINKYIKLQKVDVDESKREKIWWHSTCPQRISHKFVRKRTSSDDESNQVMRFVFSLKKLYAFTFRLSLLVYEISFFSLYVRTWTSSHFYSAETKEEREMILNMRNPRIKLISLIVCVVQR